MLHMIGVLGKREDRFDAQSTTLDSAILAACRAADDWDCVYIYSGKLVVATVSPGGYIWRRTGW